MAKIIVKETEATVVQVDSTDYIPITDIAKIRNPIGFKNLIKLPYYRKLETANY